MWAKILSFFTNPLNVDNFFDILGDSPVDNKKRYMRARYHLFSLVFVCPCCNIFSVWDLTQLQTSLVL